MSDKVTLEDVNKAYKLVQKYLVKTPLIFSPELSETTGNSVYLKLENFQRTHAFKARGALHKISSLSQQEKSKGVIAASSGNHALGVAYACSLLGVQSIVVMPVHAPAPKVKLAKRYGAKVILNGEAYDDALSHASLLSNQSGKVLLPSFDDPKVIAGQGTIVFEVLDCLSEVELIVAPIGGGGLVSGLGFTLRELDHPAKVIGIQAEGAASMFESIRVNQRIKLDQIHTIADGIAVKQPGELNFKLVNQYVDGVFTVSDKQIYQGMQRMLWDVGVVTEPAAAVAPAFLLSNSSFQNRGQSICCIITGGNVSPELLQKVVGNLPCVY